jgi:pimeloyl-ACP methyl ester carboxylesterase
MSSAVWWPEELCRQLADRGRYVIRYDHRDTGKSTSYAPGEASYTVQDLADDAVSVLEGYELERAHLAAAQGEDGGWTFNWPAWNAAAELAWRGYVTVEAPVVLPANDRL